VRRFRDWFNGAVQRWDDWCFTAPLWLLVPVGCAMAAVWLVCCFILAAFFIDLIVRVLP
jgi:hypothetical protein